MNNRADGIRSSAFPTLVDDQIEFLRRYGEVRKIEPGQVLFGEGDRSYDFREFSREPYLLETSLPGIFAVGDVRSGSVKRMTSAVGEGSMAVRFVHQYLAETSIIT
jgi:NADPH-dependent glutamate synthase beta subunit-like oxidoreductase